MTINDIFLIFLKIFSCRIFKQLNISNTFSYDLGLLVNF